MTGEEHRRLQRAAIRQFIARQDFQGKRVLDYGCGAAPYREIVEAGGGEWVGYNRSHFPGGPEIDVGEDDPLGGWVDRRWDVIVCTQMLQYVPDPAGLLDEFILALEDGGRLILTYATNWPEVEPEDLHRFTRTGMEALLTGWTISGHERLGSLPFGDCEAMAFGYGLVASP